MKGRGASRRSPASDLLVFAGALWRASPLGFPFAVLAIAAAIGILLPGALILVMLAGAALAGMLLSKTPRSAKPSRAKPDFRSPLSRDEIQNLLRTQFRAQPQMRETTRRARSEPIGRARRPVPSFASVGAVILLGVGVPLLIDANQHIGAALMVSACIFFLLHAAAHRPENKGRLRTAGLNKLLDRALGDDAQEMGPVRAAAHTRNEDHP
jgi:hypothetical protein